MPIAGMAALTGGDDQAKTAGGAEPTQMHWDRADAAGIGQKASGLRRFTGPAPT